MSGWNGYSSGSGAEHEPSEERGRAAWGSGETGALPPWASAETQTSLTPPSAAAAETQASLTPPWVTAQAQPSPAQPWMPPPAVPGSPPPAPHRVRRVFTALSLAVLVGVAVGVGVWFLIRDTSAGSAAGSGSATGAAPAPSVTATASASASPTPTPTPTPTLSTAAGYRRTQDPLGYTIDVPEDWTRTEKQGQLAPVVIYDDPADGRRLQIFRIAEDSPATSLDQAENDPGYGFARQPGYQALDRSSGSAWSELAYRYDDPDLGARQAVDHRFEAADGTLYAIRSTGPESLAPALVREPLTRALASFCPVGTECG